MRFVVRQVLHLSVSDTPYNVVPAFQKSPIEWDYRLKGEMWFVPFILRDPWSPYLDSGICFRVDHTVSGEKLCAPFISWDPLSS
jgi:hypothetical protein